MKWIILEDLIDKESVGAGPISEETIAFRAAYKKTALNERAALIASAFTSWSHDFRLKDADDEVYYVGKCDGLDDADGDHAFAPLDWCMDSMGCVTMEYRATGTTKWHEL